MLESAVASLEPTTAPPAEYLASGRLDAPPPDMETLFTGLRMQRRQVKARQYLFRAGQPRHALFLIHAGCFKTCVLSEDGREKITGFRMRGDLLGIDALDIPTYACDAIALDYGEVWELPAARIGHQFPEFQERLTAELAREIRRDWGWMLALGTLTAEQRVINFLLDFSERLEHRGFSARNLVLRMTRADLGNFLALQLETVTRALSHLHAQGLIGVACREIRINDPVALRGMLACDS